MAIFGVRQELLPAKESSFWQHTSARKAFHLASCWQQAKPNKDTNNQSLVTGAGQGDQSALSCVNLHDLTAYTVGYIQSMHPIKKEFNHDITIPCSHFYKVTHYIIIVKRCLDNVGIVGRA